MPQRVERQHYSSGEVEAFILDIRCTLFARISAGFLSPCKQVDGSFCFWRAGKHQTHLIRQRGVLHVCVCVFELEYLALRVTFVSMSRSCPLYLSLLVRVARSCTAFFNRLVQIRSSYPPVSIDLVGALSNPCSQLRMSLTCMYQDVSIKNTEVCLESDRDEVFFRVVVKKECLYLHKLLMSNFVKWIPTVATIEQHVEDSTDFCAPLRMETSLGLVCEELLSAFLHYANHELALTRFRVLGTTHTADGVSALSLHYMVCGRRDPILIREFLVRSEKELQMVKIAFWIEYELVKSVSLHD